MIPDEYKEADENAKQNMSDYNNKAGVYRLYWKDARDYTFYMLSLIADACDDEEQMKNLSHNMYIANEQYKDNCYLQGIYYNPEETYRSLKLGEGEDTRKKMGVMLRKFIDLLKNDEDSIIPPIEIFEDLGADAKIKQIEKGDNMYTIHEDTNIADLNTKFENKGEEMNANNTQGENMNTEEKVEVQVKGKSKAFKYGLGALAVAALGAAGYFGYKYLVQKD